MHIDLSSNIVIEKINFLELFCVCTMVICLEIGAKVELTNRHIIFSIYLIITCENIF